jgi:hypothetical protein
MSVPDAEAPLALLPPLPALRLLPVPVSEPPYDDELPVGVAVSATAPLGPLRGLAPAPLRLVPALPAAPGDDEDDGLARTPVSDLPPARPVAHALVQGLLEVLAGVRPVSQLQRSTTPELFLQLEQVVHGRPRHSGTRPVTGAVRSLHVQEHPEAVAEVCATVRRGPRLAAIALRLEGIGGRWCCTELAGI